MDKCCIQIFIQCRHSQSMCDAKRGCARHEWLMEFCGAKIIVNLWFLTNHILITLDMFTEYTSVARVALNDTGQAHNQEIRYPC